MRGQALHRNNIIRVIPLRIKNILVFSNIGKGKDEEKIKNILVFSNIPKERIVNIEDHAISWTRKRFIVLSNHTRYCDKGQLTRNACIL